MILACVMIMIAVSYVPCVSYDADWLAGCLSGLFGCLAGWLVGLCCIRKQDLSSADTSLYVKMIMLISITGWLASWLAGAIQQELHAVERGDSRIRNHLQGDDA